MGKVKSSEKGDEKLLEQNTNNSEVKETIKSEKEVEEKGVHDLLRELQKQIDELKSQKREPEPGDEYDTLEDYMEVPAVFFSFASEYACHSDVRNGREVLPPLGDFVKFKKLYRYNRKGANRATEVVAVSQAVVRSKKTAEWLRKHTKFGIKFFESINDAKSVDVTLAEKMSECASRVSSLSDMQVIERANSEGLRVHNDPESLRKELIQHMAMVELKRSKSKKDREFAAERDEHNRIIVKSLLSEEGKKTDVY